MVCVSLFSEVLVGWGFKKGMGGSNYCLWGGGGCNVSVSTDVVFPAYIR